MTAGFALLVLLAAFYLFIASRGAVLWLAVGLGWVLLALSTVGGIAWEILRRL